MSPEIVKQLRNTLVALTLSVSGVLCGPPSLPPGEPGFPSSGGQALAPEGNDALSSTTNFSNRAEDPASKASGLAGVAFIKPPEPNNFGAVSLAYPIEVPAGRAGMQPALSIGYSSSGGDGWAGIGWNIGLGSIARTSDYGELFYDHRDVFTYNGKRLVKVSGPANSDEGTYRTEIEGDFARLEYADASQGGVWRVRDASGTRHVYGESKASRIYDPARDTNTYSWYLARSEDRNGNYLEVEYDDDFYATNHILYLREIRYAGNAGAGQNARQYVRFETKARDDFYVSKTPGFLMKMDRLLDRIEVGYDGSALWDYRLEYRPSDDSGRPLLATVRSSRTTTEPVFGYGATTHAFAWQTIPNPNYGDPETNPEDTQYFEGDFNGDGISDLVFFNPQTGNWKAAEGQRNGGYANKLYGNRFQGYSGPEKIQFFKGNVTGDYNGDGRSDVALYLTETREFWVAEHDGRVFQFRRYGTLAVSGLDIFKAEWFPGDYDGNGLSDAVLFDEPTGDWWLMRNTGGAFQFVKFARHFKNLYRADYAPGIDQGAAATSDASRYGDARAQIHWYSGDYNGDGRTDVGFYDERSGRWWVGANYRDPNIGFRLTWTLFKEFTAPEQALFGHDRFSGDFNGDGFSDFLVFDRAAGEWIIGETRDGTIQFRVYSRTPQYREITRWLQGDFNGDGRTDIGFYSRSDRNFWIGEATPNGFRYRIYNNLENATNPDRLLAAPLPQDEVKIERGRRSFAASPTQTVLLDYVYDGNPNADRGETVFAGCYTGSDCANNPEQLIYNRRENHLYYKKGAAAPSLALDLELDAAGLRVIQGRPVRNEVTGRDEILYYTKATSFAGATHRFYAVAYVGSAFQNRLLAEFTSNDLNNFDFAESFWSLESFESASDRSLLVLDDQAATARFVHVRGTTKTAYALSVIAGAPNFKDIFRAGSQNVNRANRKFYSFFAARFTPAAGVQVLMADRTNATQKWYLGTLDMIGHTIGFPALPGTVNLPILSDEFDGSKSQAGVDYYVRDEGTTQSVVYGRATNGVQNFYKIAAYPTFTQTTYNAGTGVTYAGEHDHQGNPLVSTAAGTRVYEIAGARLITPGGAYLARSQDRADLYTKVYPFRWIQGDYNGDGKTDIGLFHLKERDWYFANTTGTSPDLLTEIENGIGGTYLLEYDNSTRFDNTGGDGVPDLPMNYKVCTKITQDDGQNGRIALNYEYKNGHAFSAYIENRKETDFFGFGEFTAIDAYGGRTIRTYNNEPHANYLLNRALAGAIKESRYLGYDNREYSRKTYEYQIHTIAQGAQTRLSYMVTPALERSYVRGALVETKTLTIDLSGYSLDRRAEELTDHYSDSAHASETLATETTYETDPATNQQRPALKKNLSGTYLETTEAYTYDGRGNLSRRTITATGANVHAADPRIAEYDYDSAGNTTEERDVSASPARVTQYAYDTALQQFVTERRQITDSGTLSTTYQINYDNAFGRPQRVTDPNGNHTYNDYDAYGRTVALRADTPNGTATLEAYTYSANYPLSARTDYQTGTSDPGLSFRVYTDGLGRQIHTVRTADNGRYTRTGRIVYDAIGRVIRKGQTEYAAGDELDNYRVIVAEKNPTITTYDSSGRVQSVTLPKAASENTQAVITTTYNDPWEVRATHSGGTTKTTIKNARGHVLTVTDSGTGDDSQTVSASIGFCYDQAGNRTQKNDLNGASLTCANPNTAIPALDTSGNNLAHWRYDSYGRTHAQSDPDLGVTTIAYNAFGDATSRTDALGRTTTMSYDRLGRMVQKNLPGSEGTVYYRYDEHPESSNAKGRLTSIDDPAATVILSYDELGRVEREKRIINEHTTTETDVPYVAAFTYDNLNRTKEINYPQNPRTNQGARACYTYNTFGYLQSAAVRANAASAGGCDESIINSTAYNEFGQITQVAYGNSVTANYQYDVKGRLEYIQTTAPNGATTKTIQNAQYTFDAQDRIKRVQNDADDFQTDYQYAYDGINRLITAAGSYVETDDGTGTAQTTPLKYKHRYGYADNGNLTRRDYVDPDTDALNERWNYTYVNHQARTVDSTVDGARFQMSYDLAGNMTGQIDLKTNKEKQITLDSYDRIREVRDPTITEAIGQYWYDDRGFRIRKKAKHDKGGDFTDVETVYPSMYFGMELIGESNTLNSVANIYHNGLRIAAVAQNGAKVWYLQDQVDSVKLVMGSAGQVLSRAEYLPYGETFVQKGDEDFAPKYNSQELDRETNYYFYNARYYDPQIARFTSADTIIDGEGSSQGWNRYMYVHGNPIGAKDPTGHSEVPADIQNQRKEEEESRKAYDEFVKEKGTIKPVATGDSSPEKAELKEGNESLGKILNSREKQKAAQIEKTKAPGAGINAVTPEQFRHSPEVTEYTNELIKEQSGKILNRLINFAIKRAFKLQESENELNAKNKSKKEQPAQEKKLTKAEIEKLIKSGNHPHDLKKEGRSKQDLFKDEKGNIIIKDKKGNAQGEETGININDI